MLTCSATAARRSRARATTSGLKVKHASLLLYFCFTSALLLLYYCIFIAHAYSACRPCVALCAPRALLLQLPLYRPDLPGATSLLALLVQKYKYCVALCAPRARLLQLLLCMPDLPGYLLHWYTSTCFSSSKSTRLQLPPYRPDLPGMFSLLAVLVQKCKHTDASGAACLADLDMFFQHSQHPAATLHAAARVYYYKS
jgi:hypothetical protein